MMNYRRLAARAGLPAWMLIAPLSFAQEVPSEEEPADAEKTEELVPVEKSPAKVEGLEKIPVEELEKKAPVIPPLPEPELPEPETPAAATTGEPLPELPEVEDPLLNVPSNLGSPLPEGDPLSGPVGDAPLLPGALPEAPDPETGSMLDDEPPSFGQGFGGQRGQNNNMDPQTALSTRDNDTEGLVLSIGVTETYSSNLELDETDRLSVFYTTITPGISYRSAPSEGAINVLAVNYEAGFDFYHSGEIDNATNHRLASILTHNGSKLFAEFTGEYYQATEASRFSETLAENTTITARLQLDYSLSNKTSLNATAEFSQLDSSAGGASASDVFGATLSALYIYSPKTRFGPSIRYASSDSDASGKITSIAFGADIRYRPTDKIRLESTFGIESVDLPSGSSQTSPTATFAARYRPNPIWSFTGEIRYEAIPINSGTGGTVGLLPGEDPLERLNGPGDDGDQQINATLGVEYTPGDAWRISATLNHRTSPSVINPGETLTDTSFGLGISHNFGKSELSFRYSRSLTEFDGGPVMGAGARSDQEFQQFSLSYSYPDLFRGFDLGAGISYLENTGSREYDEISVDVSANYRF